MSLFFGAATDAALKVSPPTIEFDRPECSEQMLVMQSGSESREFDVTRRVTYTVQPEGIVSVSPDGIVQPLAEGTAQLTVQHEQQSVTIPVSVSGLSTPVPVSFSQDIMPVLTKYGCNSGRCHAKAEGQKGFKLSVFGYDAVSDYDAVTKDSRSRRINLAAPEQSLILRKASARIPHGGGKKFHTGSFAYRRMHRWISEGAAFINDPATTVVKVEVEPASQILALDGEQQLRVTAIDASGRRRGVTAESQFESNNGTVAEVDNSGLISANNLVGEAAIFVRYQGMVSVCNITVPRPAVTFPRPAENNFIDGLVWNKLERLGIAPSEPADDAMFLRRVYLDTIGTLPTADEVRTFLSDTDPQKRSKTIDALLEREEYNDYWALRWADVMRVDREKITPHSALGMTRWLKSQLEENRPYDRMVHDILTARGPTTAESPAAFFKALNTPDLASKSISQLFLGVRIECAQCHHHPSERWTQEDFWALGGFFTGLSVKPIPGGTDSLVSFGGTNLKQPKTGEEIPAQVLGGQPIDFTNITDRRIPLADWLTSSDNPYFAQAIANRLWAHYFGRGLIHPIDDVRETNPPSNEALMAALTQHMRDVQFDLKAFTKTLLNSQVYQLSSLPNEINESDRQNFSHALTKALPAEVLLDEICQATGVPEKFNGWPEGYRSIQIWDNRMPSYFFRIFGRPVRASVCECERSNEPSISQALHLLNSPEIAEKIHSRKGKARTLADSSLTPAEIVDEIYLMTLTRYPSDEERSLFISVYDAPEITRRQATEDLLWAVMNAKEFLYNH
ncbi:MAG: DUF1549 domain-containing protein [Planctomycetota bacterium]|nr:DUF1549 domain-containing protein [Planctomycetota bacterium]MDA1213603.1 DUF1549 domain-containing protein [Planctomycetota bacterium]